jgi:hypothetical protein
MPDYTSIRATTDTAEMLREVAFALTGKTRRRVSQSDALRAVCTVALRHLEETAEVITKPNQGADTSPEPGGTP